MTGAITNILFNMILIPIINIYGAALASVITQFFTNVLVGYIIKPIKYNNSIMLRSLNPKYVVMVLDKIRKRA